MALAQNSPQSEGQLESSRREWVARIEQLVDQIAKWSETENWQIERHEKVITERLLGTYTVPELIVRAVGGQLIVNPIGLRLVGGDGRVDLEAIPTLSRVKLIGTHGGWQVWTDSNVPLRIDWNQENFLRLARDLLS